ncbi:MAG: carboxypeptidase-like regulatory domain-containing protein, partial [Acidobacteriaceae bacterium]
MNASARWPRLSGFLALLACLTLPGCCLAQTQTVSGTVTDISGAVIPGATVTATRAGAATHSA